jgi:hypothetical protein
MAIGGNQRARQFFKQHGWDDIGADKIEGKVSRAGSCPAQLPGQRVHPRPPCTRARAGAEGLSLRPAPLPPARPPPQYTSRAAQLYRQTLDKESSKATAARCARARSPPATPACLAAGACPPPGSSP